MSSNLTWGPVQRSSGSLSNRLKWALRSEFGNPINTKIYSRNTNHTAFLRGLKNGGLEEADDLLKDLAKYEIIFLKEEY